MAQRARGWRLILLTVAAQLTTLLRLVDYFRQFSDDYDPNESCIILGLPTRNSATSMVLP